MIASLTTYVSIIDKEPDEGYYKIHFHIAAQLLIGLMGINKYIQWFDQRFPGDGDNANFDWKEKWEAAEAAYSRITDGDPQHRGALIAKELDITIEDGDDGGEA